MILQSTHTSGPSTRHILLTGVTGFVGQAMLERLLSSTDARVSVLIRSRNRKSAQQRLDELLDKPVFQPLRARLGDESMQEAVRSRVHVIEGDLRDVPDLPGDLDGVVHSASSVNFDDPIDKAFTTNVGGPHALYRALARSGGRTRRAHVVHISTSYVATGRVQVATEVSLEHDVDWRAETSRAVELRGRLARAGHEPREQLAMLRRAGKERARELGWTDVYTLTKALGERVAEDLWAGQGRRLTILRPTIIESALRYPYPGWIDGFKVADPLIAAYAQGRLLGFPGRPESVLDIIPVDFVVNAAGAALDNPPASGQSRYLQVSSGTTNPLTLAELRVWVQDYFAAHPWIDRDGQVIEPEPWEFSDPERLDRWAARRQRALRNSATLLELAPAGWFAHARAGVRAGLRGLDTLRGYVDLYQPYTCATTTYDDTHTRELLGHRRNPRDLFDVNAIDWQRYLTQAHLPALVAIMEGRQRTPSSGAPRTAVSPLRRPRPRAGRHTAEEHTAQALGA
ncbi:nucleoside-diphosphate-sugar epimerase [Kineosphaera limosa]|uniref:Thioester reductase (TE) domain-containing protein n=1 Tax=Kineosphaera limosa NBRC 100340 TaxID=1184609 RepID=K6XBW0_9MICO|nr:SDR family oxidoreductase [Kineosphaera limosa]NYD99246.1 nucleoside-diphosphate-sugar epimerase [Kineosphaera limosa]GAB96284.1 hypothetical protein KILIM_034_00330 [Kineosphaera limosa NBRC 100340]